MKLLKNIVDYNEPLDKVKVGTHTYRTNKEFIPSVILAQSFGAGFGETSYNMILAETLKDSISFFGNLPSIVQHEVGDCLDRLGYFNFFSVGENYSQKDGSLLTSKIDTNEVLINSKELVDRMEIDPKKVLYIAHPAHIYRVLELGDRIGLGGFPFIAEDVKWPVDDPQQWVKSPTKWRIRELFLARIHDRIF